MEICRVYILELYPRSFSFGEVPEIQEFGFVDYQMLPSQPALRFLRFCELKDQYVGLQICLRIRTVSSPNNVLLQVMLIPRRI